MGKSGLEEVADRVDSELAGDFAASMAPHSIRDYP
jgi:hypothetical protein